MPIRVFGRWDAPEGLNEEDKAAWTDERRRILNHVTLTVASRLAIPIVLVIIIPVIIGFWLNAKQRNERINSIQQSRAQVTLENCLGQNTRHANVVDRLSALTDQARGKVLDKQAAGAISQKEAALQLAQLDRNQAATVYLINALAPHQNCVKMVRERFGDVPVLDSK